MSGQYGRHYDDYDGFDSWAQVEDDPRYTERELLQEELDFARGWEDDWYQTG